MIHHISKIVKLSRYKYIKILLGFLYNGVVNSHIYFVAETTITHNCFTPGSKLPFPFFDQATKIIYMARALRRKHILFLYDIIPRGALYDTDCACYTDC